MYVVNSRMRKRDGKQILKEMRKILDRYGNVTLADFKDLMGIFNYGYEDNKKGWRSLKGAKIKRKFRGVKFVLPDLVFLD